MKQSFSLFRNLSLLLLSFSVVLVSCSKNKTEDIPVAAFAGQYLVVDDNETYTLKVDYKGNGNFQIKEFGGFLNAALNAVADGNSLKIPSQTFTNPNGNSITIVGTGTLATKNTKDDTIKFQYTVSGFSNYSGDFEGTRN